MENQRVDEELIYLFKATCETALEMKLNSGQFAFFFISNLVAHTYRWAPSHEMARAVIQMAIEEGTLVARGETSEDCKD